MTLSNRLAFTPESSFPLSAEQQGIRNRAQARIDDGTYAVESSACLCGDRESKLIAERDGYGLRLPTVMCLRCGLLRSEPRLSEPSWKRFIGEDLPAMATEATAPLDRLFDEQVTQGAVLAREMPSLLAQVSTVYEVGCGAGGRLIPLKKLGKTVTGCDKDERLLALGRSKGLDLLSGGPVELLAHMKEPADLIFLSWIVDRMRDPITELRDAVQLVRPGGIILVLVPGLRQIDSQFRSNILRFIDTGKLYHFSEATMRYLLSRIGLDVVLCDQTIIAAARRPSNWTPTTLMEISPNAEEPASMLLHLTAAEREHDKRHAPTRPAGSPLDALEAEGALQTMAVPQIAIKEAPANTPMALGTKASLRVLAWPDYTSSREIETHLRIAEPMYGKADACLCLRYDASIDPPMNVVQDNLKIAFDLIGREVSLNILIIDDLIAQDARIKLGQALTAAILVDPTSKGHRADFIRDLACPLITGKKD
ncbi:MAG: class I SAM-dependent methyltransferase [Myxococcota bacterium]|jgi:SAM-dependent methyltransferase|nr:class I SAM-dependent methyltransferase [Myxococcota bacterium]